MIIFYLIYLLVTLSPYMDVSSILDYLICVCVNSWHLRIHMDLLKFSPCYFLTQIWIFKLDFWIWSNIICLAHWELRNGNNLKTVTFHVVCAHWERISWLIWEKECLNKEARIESKITFEYEKSVMRITSFSYETSSVAYKEL